MLLTFEHHRARQQRWQSMLECKDIIKYPYLSKQIMKSIMKGIIEIIIEIDRQLHMLSFNLGVARGYLALQGCHMKRLFLCQCPCVTQYQSTRLAPSTWRYAITKQISPLINCCVFRPANGCSPRRLLVKIIKTTFFIFFVTNGKKERKKKGKPY